MVSERILRDHILTSFFPVSPVVITVYPDSSQIEYTVNLGNMVTFFCEATGIPPPSITWYRNGTKLDSFINPRVTLSQNSGPLALIDNNGETFFLVNRTLVLRMSEDGDSGIYECNAGNEATQGEDSMQFELVVQSKFDRSYIIITLKWTVCNSQIPNNAHSGRW